MTGVVLDASAVLALLQREPGAERVTAALHDTAVMSAVNLSEVVAKLSEHGMPSELIHAALDPLDMDVHISDADLAYEAGLLRPLTRQAGLSLGDRFCLALAQRLTLPVLTADHNWSALSISIQIELIR